MRWLLIALGLITLYLAVVLARENLWWIAIPDGAFGLGVAWVAWQDMRASAAPGRVSAEPAAQPQFAPPPEPQPAPLPLAATVPAPRAGAEQAPPLSANPRSSHKRRGRKHRH